MKSSMRDGVSFKNPPKPMEGSIDPAFSGARQVGTKRQTTEVISGKAAILNKFRIWSRTDDLHHVLAPWKQKVYS